MLKQSIEVVFVLLQCHIAMEIITPAVLYDSNVFTTKD